NLAYECYMTEDELEEEREAQRQKGQVPKYSGAHRDLTEVQKEAFRQEGRQPSIRIRVPENKTYHFNDIVRGTNAIESSDYCGWVIATENSIPSYNFAAAIDEQ